MAYAETMEMLGIPTGSNRKDLRLHGSYEFPVAVYYAKQNGLRQNFINWHWHDEMHFYIVKKGRMTFYANSAVHELCEGEGIFVNGGCVHMIKPAGPSENAHVTLMFHHKLFSGFQGSAIERKYILPYIESEKMTSVTFRNEVPWQSYVLKILSGLCRLCASPDYGYELEIVIELLKVWRLMVTNISLDDACDGEKSGQSAGVSSLGYRKMKSILSYINTHYMEKITLEEIARTVGLSRNECCRFFKRCSNCTIFQYITDYRISKACELLASKDRGVKEIAYAVGFGDAGYFITRFKNKTGCTPKEYRGKKSAPETTPGAA